MIVLRAPERFLNDLATEEQKKTIATYKELIDRAIKGEKVTIVLPSERDPETKQPLFEIVDLITGVRA